MKFKIQNSKFKIIIWNKLFKTILLILPWTILTQVVNAQGVAPPATCTGFAIGGLCLNIISPFRGIAKRGLFSAFAQLFLYMFLILFVLWMLGLVLAIINYIRSEGNQEMIEQSNQRIMNLWRGTSIGLGAFVAIAIFGILLGGGNPLDWPDELAVCGAEHEVYYQAADRLTKGLAPGSSVDIYCCTDTQVGGANKDGWFDSGTKPATPPGTCEFAKTEVVK